MLKRLHPHVVVSLLLIGALAASPLLGLIWP